MQFRCCCLLVAVAILIHNLADKTKTLVSFNRNSRILSFQIQSNSQSTYHHLKPPLHSNPFRSNISSYFTTTKQKGKNERYFLSAFFSSRISASLSLSFNTTNPQQQQHVAISQPNQLNPTSIQLIHQSNTNNRTRCATNQVGRYAASRSS